MKTLPFTGLLLCQLIFPAAHAQPQQPSLPRVVPDASGGEAAAEAFRKLPVCSLAPDGKKLLVEPCRPAPSRNFTQRRSVPQTVLTMPPSQQSQQPLPQLSRPPATAYMPAPAPAPVPAPAIRPLGTCDAAGCRDASGTRYQGTGPVLLDPAGRPCRTDGQWVQC
ncbi:hypothetical protein ASC94_23705 [Massilia sp. Root418]|uniref:hypothetical protein n=1 Tax=Massilia sp. Root418 TaxID=1736532 RepID=UPI0006F21BA0|nr:hypothetical protein [Massilia sp. Root418]KQW88433.1 hypothetical protein ASC94_23705 [Massilia sp. Root418]